MKALNLKLDACAKPDQECPYYRLENVIKESGRGYDYLHICRKSARGIIYAEKVNRDNDPEDIIPSWCELPNQEKEIDNGMQKASSEKEERLSTVPTGSSVPDSRICANSTGSCGPG